MIMMPSSVVAIPSVDFREGQVRKENGKTVLECCDVQRTVSYVQPIYVLAIALEEPLSRNGSEGGKLVYGLGRE